MSCWSGEYDLYDFVIASEEKDEYTMFEEFKKKTNGVIYQSIIVPLTIYNRDFLNDNCKFFKVNKSIEEVDDKRKKTGKKVKVNYTYEYLNKEYLSISDFNKSNSGVIVDKEIKIDTILDLIPYYPYHIVSFYCDKDKMIVHIGRECPFDKKEAEKLSYGMNTKYEDYKRRELQKHYIDVMEKYLNRTGRIVTEELKVFSDKDKLYVTTSYPIDYNFELKIVRKDNELLFAEPKIIDYNKGLVDVSNTLISLIDDKNNLCEVSAVKDKITITYTKAKEKINNGE